MPVSETTFRLVALEDPEGHWELHGGTLRRKPSMSYDHNRAAPRLFAQLLRQLDEREFDVRVNMGHLHLSPGRYYIPDVVVIPMHLGRAQRGRRDLEAYDAPLPLVVEVWSPSTGDYDLEVKLPDYQRRGDPEIWLLHPHERTLTAWRRQTDGSYHEERYRGGTITPVALPGVVVEVDALFD